jgi:cytochrome c553
MIPLPRTLLALVATAGGALAGSERPVTFNEDIAPIIHAKCANCHRSGQIAPFPLLTYADVKRRAQQIVDVTDERFMPPWHADPDVIEYANDRSLKADEIKRIAQWVAAGKPEGDPAKTPAPPQFRRAGSVASPILLRRCPSRFPCPRKDLTFIATSSFR